MGEQGHKFVDYWAIHSERDGRPAMVGWARSEAEATERMEALRAEDPEASQAEYWVMRMTEPELESYRLAGVIPADA